MNLPANLTRGLDVALDRLVVPGYTRIGPALRRTWWPADPPADALAGSVVAVTGANSGLGRATALGAARLGAEVRMLCRNVDRGAAARDEILREVPGAVLHVDECDLSDLAAVREVGAGLARQVPVFPPSTALRQAQDREREKRLFEFLGIPVAPWRAVSSRKDLEQAAVLAAAIEEETPGRLVEVFKVMPKSGKSIVRRGTPAVIKLLHDSHEEARTALGMIVGR